VKYQEELAESCPECKVEPGTWCVYILSSVATPGYSHPSYQLERAGKPTKRLHNGRFNAAWQTRRRKKRAAEIAMLQEFFQRFGLIFEEGRL
jgi:hypothetical protein